MKKKTLKRIKQNKKTKKVYRGGESLINKKDRKNALKSLCTQILERKKENKDNCILVHFLTGYTGSIYKYPTIPKYIKSTRQGIDTLGRKTVGNNSLSRDIVIITEFRNINNTQEEIYKDDIYHYILTFNTITYANMPNNDYTDYSKYMKKNDVETFFNTFKRIYNNNNLMKCQDSEAIKTFFNDFIIYKSGEYTHDMNKLSDKVAFENAFVTKKLSFCDIYDNKNKFFSNIPIIKIINLTKCDFKKQKFVDPLSNNNKSNNYNDVDLIIENENYENNVTRLIKDDYTSTLFMKSIYEPIKKNNDSIISKKIYEKTLNKAMFDSAISVCKLSNDLHSMYNYKYTLSYSYDFIRSKELIDKNVEVADDKNVEVADDKNKYINFIVNIDQPKIPEYIKPKISERSDALKMPLQRQGIITLESKIKKINKEWKNHVCLSK